MATVLLCPAMFNLAETTRMIEVSRALHPQHRAVFLGYETDYASLVVDAGFEYRAGTPAWSAAERRQALAFDQGRSWRSPFSRALVTARVTLERSAIRELRAAVVVTGSNLTSFLSARAEGVPLVYPVPFALTHPQVAQTPSMGLVDGSGHLPSPPPLPWAPWTWTSSSRSATTSPPATWSRPTSGSPRCCRPTGWAGWSTQRSSTVARGRSRQPAPPESPSTAWVCNPSRPGTFASACGVGTPSPSHRRRSRRLSWTPWSG